MSPVCSENKAKPNRQLDVELKGSWDHGKNNELLCEASWGSWELRTPGGLEKLQKFPCSAGLYMQKAAKHAGGATQHWLTFAGELEPLHLFDCKAQDNWRREGGNGDPALCRMVGCDELQI